MTIPYAEVIGDPIAHSKSPLIHNFWLEKLGIEGEYRKTHVLTAELPAYIANRRADPNWRGCNVTIPHKETVLHLIGHGRGSAIAVGAANCIFKESETVLTTANTDVDGISEALPEQDIRGAVACVIGAGGAARAALQTLRMSGVRTVNSVVRDVAKGDTLLKEFALTGNVWPIDRCEEAFFRASIIINASPLGMSEKPPMPSTLLSHLRLSRENAIVFDMVYAPLETSLLKAAGDAGKSTRDGLTMLIGQARSAFHYFYAAKPPREHDAELRALLTA